MKLDLAERRAKINKMQEQIFADVHKYLPISRPDKLQDATNDIVGGRAVRSTSAFGAHWDGVRVGATPEEEDLVIETSASAEQDITESDEEVLPERLALPFPSSIGREECATQKWLAPFLTERHMREAVMREALELARRGIGGKAYMFVKERHRETLNAGAKTRSAKRVQEYTAAIKASARLYCLTRDGWMALGPSAAKKTEFRELRAEHLTSVRSAIDHKARGTKTVQPSWIWGARLESTEYVHARECFPHPTSDVDSDWCMSQFRSISFFNATHTKRDGQKNSRT
jgi:hypothetical protein